MIVRVFLIVFGILSVVLLGAAAYYGFFAGDAPPPQAEAPQPPPPPPVMVAAASHPIPTGSLIQLQDLRFVAVQPGQDTAGLFMRNNAPTPQEQPGADKAVMDQMAGAVTRHRFNENDPILRSEVVKPGDAGFLAAVLQPGKRATTIGVTAVTGAAGLVYPGDHVDVVLTQVFAGKENDPGNRSVAETIATDVRVIAVDQQLQANAAPNKDGKIASTVTLEADPTQVQTLEVAAKMGELSLAIRGVPHEGDEPGVNVANVPTPAPVWAHDVSPAAARNTPRGVAPPPPANDNKDAKNQPPPGDGKPAIRVMRGDKAESIALP